MTDHAFDDRSFFSRGNNLSPLSFRFQRPLQSDLSTNVHPRIDYPKRINALCSIVKVKTEEVESQAKELYPRFSIVRRNYTIEIMPWLAYKWLLSDTMMHGIRNLIADRCFFIAKEIGYFIGGEFFQAESDIRESRGHAGEIAKGREFKNAEVHVSCLHLAHVFIPESRHTNLIFSSLWRISFFYLYVYF